MFSALLEAIIFGDIAGLVQSLSKDETRIQELNAAVFEVMNDLNLEEEFKDTIRKYTAKTLQTQLAQSDFNKFIK